MSVRAAAAEAAAGGGCGGGGSGGAWSVAVVEEEAPVPAGTVGRGTVAAVEVLPVAWVTVVCVMSGGFGCGGTYVLGIGCRWYGGGW